METMVVRRAMVATVDRAVANRVASDVEPWVVDQGGYLAQQHLEDACPVSL